MSKSGKRGFDPRNVVIGSGLQLFEVSTLGQPFEVIKTTMAANRNDTLTAAMKRLYSSRGVASFWQGLIPWAWIEAATKGGVLLFSQNEISSFVSSLGFSTTASNAMGGIGGGICQAYTTMGFCTFMKTVEVTRSKTPGTAQQSTMAVAGNIMKSEGILGMYKGVNAVALRQATNWGSRFGFSRLIESALRRGDNERKLTKRERFTSSVLGGALAVWNQPIEVIRVEMQSMAKAADRPDNLSISDTARYIYNKDGLRGMFRGVIPRIGLSAYLTTVMVFGGDEVKQYLKTKPAAVQTARA